jgi:hypothetical protein
MFRLLFASLAASALVAVPVASQAAILVYQAVMSGPAESPPNASPGVGFGIITIDTVANTININDSFSGLTGTTSASHIHCCTTVPLTGTAIVATTVPNFPGFPLGVSSGTFNGTFDLGATGSYNPAFITANGGTVGSAQTALLAGIAAGQAYLNIHSTTFPGGEIRGFLTPVPEPATWAMMIVGFGLVGAGLRLRRRREAAA